MKTLTVRELRSLLSNLPADHDDALVQFSVGTPLGEAGLELTRVSVTAVYTLGTDAPVPDYDETNPADAAAGSLLVVLCNHSG